MKPKKVASYPYHDADGTLLYESVRYVPKDFRQRRPHPTLEGHWINNMDGVQRVLYRLPQLRDGLRGDPNRTVFVVEGESSADLWAERLKLITTTNVGGAGKWLPSYTEELRGQKVVLLYDWDAVDKVTGVRPGYQHAVKVCNSLHGVAKSVKAVLMPGLAEGEDPDDWLNRQGDWDDEQGVKALRHRTIAALSEIINRTPVWEPVEERRDEVAPFARGVASTLSAARSSLGGLSSQDQALGKLRRAYLWAEKGLTMRQPNLRELGKDLMHLGALVQMMAEDLGCVPSLEDSAAAEAGESAGGQTSAA